MRAYSRILGKTGLILIGGLSGCFGLLQAQSVGLTASASSADPIPAEVITLTFEIEEEADIFYMGVEVVFDENVATFTGIESGDLMEEGLEIAGMLTKDRVGASVTRTSSTESSSTGTLMELNFLIDGKAPAGESAFSFSSLELTDSKGEEVESSDLPDLDFDVQKALSDLVLTLPEEIEIHRGELLDVTGKVYVNGWTDIESIESEDIHVWFGLNGSDTDPADWGESSWTQMIFDEKESDGYHAYLESAGYQTEAGIYFIALRAQFEEGDFKYGGQSGVTGEGGGFWDGEENRSTKLEVLDTSSTFVYTIVEWNFDTETYLPWRGLPVNMGSEFVLSGAKLNGFSTGSPDRSANSNGWNSEEDGTPYWMASFSTEGLGNITLSSKQYGSGTGPGKFKLQGRVANGSWDDIPGGEITVESNWTAGVVDHLELPSDYNDQAEVSIRWRLVGDINVNGEENISGSGSNRIDGVIVRGENLNPVEMSVWPGDADNNGSVDEEDVLVLGVNWLLEGPLPIFNTIGWEERNVEAWVPVEATSADTDGNGIVDHRDLKIIGLNFGQSRNSGKQQDAIEPLAELYLEPVEPGRKGYVYVMTDSPIQLTGLSYRVQLRNAPSGQMRVEGIRPGRWAEEWMETEHLLSYNRQDIESGWVEGAFVHLGFTPDKSAGLLLTLELNSERNWAEPVSLLLDRLSYTDQSGHKHSLKDVRLEFSETGDMREYRPPPNKTLLAQNYPNPFNPNTIIRYSLSVPGDVRLEVYNIAGRRINTLINQRQEAGYHAVNFNGSGLASGIYIYRLLANEQVYSKRMLLVK
ncbi:MAG: T9SS type A sorting domain-containing protein [Balneolaceae bacterium]